MADNGFGFACRAPDGEGELEADSKDAFGDFVGASAERVRGGVEGGCVVGIRRIVAAHVEALHFEDGRVGMGASCAG